MINHRIISSSLIDSDIATQLLNYKVIRLIQHGFSGEGIANLTGLTNSQIHYRVRMYELQGVRRQFRNGATPAADVVVKLAVDVPKAKQKRDSAVYECVRKSVLAAYKSNPRPNKKGKTKNGR
jgi:hypothetical protein